jgi:alcohol dehydrogenase
MRAAVCAAVRAPLELRDLPDPVPPRDGVVLRVLACGICRSDWHAWTGADPVALPIVPGHEFCGDVVAAGPEVRRWRPGDRVVAPFILACGSCPDCAAGRQTVCAEQVLPGFTAPGAFAEYLALPHADANLARLPEALDPALAAAFGCRVATAWQALTGRAALAPGEWLAVIGAGGLGLAALILGRALGARVVAVDVAPERLAQAARLGAAATVDARDGDAADAVRAATGGGAHVALEAVGRAATTALALSCLRPMGRLVQAGMPTGTEAAATLPWDRLYAGQLAVFGTRGMPGWRYPGLFDFLLATGTDLSPLIARRVALSDASAELAAFDRPGPPGIAVITDFAA